MRLEKRRTESRRSVSEPVLPVHGGHHESRPAETVAMVWIHALLQEPRENTTNKSVLIIIKKQFQNVPLYLTVFFSMNANLTLDLSKCFFLQISSVMVNDRWDRLRHY